MKIRRYAVAEAVLRPDPGGDTPGTAVLLQGADAALDLSRGALASVASEKSRSHTRSVCVTPRFCVFRVTRVLFVSTGRDRQGGGEGDAGSDERHQGGTCCVQLCGMFGKFRFEF